jgi:acyl-CoA dehydrogenase
VTTNGWEDDELRSLRALTREFAQREILPHQEQWEREGELPRALHRTAGDAGLLGAAFPEAVGGGGGDLRVMTTVVEALHESGVAGGVQASLFTCGIALPHPLEAGNPEQIDRWVRPTLAGDKIGAPAITEPSGGSDVGHLRTTARRQGDHYVVNGAKTYITSGCRADFVVAAVRWPRRAGYVAARHREEHSRLRGLPQARQDGLALVRHRGAVVHGRPGASGQPCRGRGHGFPLIGTGFVSERIALAAQAYSIAQRALDMTVQWCRDRETFGAPLISRQAVQNTLSEMARRVDVARVYTHQVVDRAIAGEHDIIPAVCFAKNTAVEAGQWVVDQAVQLHGGMGYMTECEVERHYRDMRIVGIGGGTNEILTTLAAKHLGYQS